MNMGLLDVLNGMQNGPRGQRAPSSGTGTTGTTGIGGMSPITMALLGLLAFKALKSFGGSSPAPAPAGAKPTALPGTTNAALPGGAAGPGGLGDMLKGGLGGLLAGGAAGSILSGGLGDLIKQLQQAGHGDTANSWVGNGQNKTIAPGDLLKALGPDQVNSLMSQSGLSRDELLAGLSEQLPAVVNHLTPDGRVPTEQEMSRLV
jgi:uncharacterized protein YidB (DUF937 family)